jgi:hypothetical protein
VVFFSDTGSLLPAGKRSVGHIDLLMRRTADEDQLYEADRGLILLDINNFVRKTPKNTLLNSNTARPEGKEVLINREATPQQIGVNTFIL